MDQVSAAFQRIGVITAGALPLVAIIGGTFVFVTALVAGIAACFVRNPIFKIMYYVYAHTPLGQFIHDFQLSSHAKSAAKRRAQHLDAAESIEESNLSGAMHSALASFSVHFPVPTGSQHGLVASVMPIPVMGDNYQYLVLTPTDPKNAEAAGIQTKGGASAPRQFMGTAVDVSDADLLLAVVGALEAQANIQVTLTHILTTHRHMDHCGGHRKLMAVWSRVRQGPPPEIVAPLLDPTPGVTQTVRHGDTVHLLPDIQQGTISGASKPHLVAHVMSVPGHTVGHAWYVLAPAGFDVLTAGDSGDTSGWGPADAVTATAASMQGSHEEEHTAAADDAEPQVAAPCVLFSGDTLFVGGVGKFFEGTAAQMVRNLYSIAGAGLRRPSASLPRHTIVCTGHEYAQPNLAFAQWLQPRNAAVAAKVRWTTAARSCAIPRPTPVTTLAEECTFNPFMRCDNMDVLQALSELSDSVLAAASAASDCEVHESAALIRSTVQSTPSSTLLSSNDSVLIAAMSLLRALKDAEVQLKFKQTGQ